MDFDRLAALSKWMSASPVAELEWSEGSLRVKLVRASNFAEPRSWLPTAPEMVAETPLPFGEYVVTAPFFGVVPLAPASGARPHVVEGQEIKQGDTLCTIEAMKVFNTVVAERPGILKEILVSTGAEVSIGQPLFRIAPDGKGEDT